ncbi:MAG: hypothetical protein ACOCRZ_03140 [Halothermotrichaceae bacterium]
MKLKYIYNKYIVNFFRLIKESIVDYFIYIIGAIILSIINAGIALLVNEFYYYPDVFWGLKFNLINLSIIYLIIFALWYLIIKNIEDFFD